MRRWNLFLSLVLAVIWLATPTFADRVDIANTSGLGNLIQSDGTTLTGDFSVNLRVSVHFNESTGIYSYVYTLSMPSGLIDGPAFHVNPGGLFDLAGMNWGLVTGPGFSSAGMSLEFAGTTGPGVLLPDGSTYFIFSDFGRGDTITVYGQSTRPPTDLLAGLLENLSHRVARGSIPQVPEPGTLVLLGTGLGLVSAAIRRRLGNRKKA